MIVEQLVPFQKNVELSELSDSFKFAQCQNPFASALVELIDDVAQSLFTAPAAKEFPELQALAFFMRRANVLSMRPKTTGEATCVRVPIGRVLHFAPTNVDTMFVYSWLLSAVTGNVILVRVSKSRRAPQTELICELFNRVLEKHDPKLQSTIAVISYDHCEEITSRLCSIADLRVMWGGDATIDEIRKHPLKSGARDLPFPDRFSISAIDSKNYLNLTDDRKIALANDFFNDSYWFDQAACSSPRHIFWCGTDNENDAAKVLFFECLSQVLSKRSFTLDAGPALSKMTNTYDCIIESSVKSATILGNELTVLSLDDYGSLLSLPMKHSNFGTFYSSGLNALHQLLPLLTKKIQTLTYFGFERNDLTKFAEAANGAGIDRIVPIGQALSFHRMWDGFDLIDQYTKLVHIR